MPVTQVRQPLPLPVMIYDADCGFCKRWIWRWQRITGSTVLYQSYQETIEKGQFPEIPESQYAHAVQLIHPDGSVTEGSQAVFEALATQSRYRWLLQIYERFSWVRQFTEFAYRQVAQHRMLFSRLTRPFVSEPPVEFRLTRHLFLIALGLIYLMAFGSLSLQLTGLIGSNGILPVADLMDYVRAEQPDVSWWQLPTLSWLNSGDWLLQAQCLGGILLSLLLMLGLAPAIITLLLWLLYLSLVASGQVFLAFQWDVLLLETGFLAIFLSPLSWAIWRGGEPSRVIILLLRWLILRFMFLSGLVKITSADASWRALTALQFHYETQPLPNPLAWFAHQLPPSLHLGAAAAMFFIELIVPLIALGPRRGRQIAAAFFALLQILIAATGNYGFFNWLTLALCIPLLDDAAWRRLMPGAVHRALVPLPDPQRPLNVRGRWPAWITAPVAICLLLFSIVPVLSSITRPAPVPGWLASFYARQQPFHLVNSYGLFAVMTLERPEILIEGSADGIEWKPYDFRYKPDAPDAAPPWVAPHMPRLDWQLWFAALGDYRQNPWFLNLCLRLLEGEPEVLQLLKSNPFPDEPPRFIRAELYDYRFTHENPLREGLWWERTYKDLYCPILQQP